MQDSKREENRTTEDKKDETKQRSDSEATSKDTVEDLEQGNKISDSKSENPAGGTSVPSPDGMSDGERGGRADGSDTGGPM